MGKIPHITFLTCAVLFCGSAVAKPRLATHLPSAVKKTRVLPSRKAQARVTPYSHVTGKMTAADFAPELRAEAANHPSAAKFYSRTVYYVRSNAPVPAEYDCNENRTAIKLGEAEVQAKEKCLAAGKSSCELALSVVAKSGVLRCSDFPNGQCPGSGHYRGCVAEALVVSEKADEQGMADAGYETPLAEMN